MISKKNAVVVRTTNTATVTTAPYHQLVGETCAMIKTFNGKCLDMYWALGRKVKDLMDKPDTYGQHTLENFAADLAQAGRISLGTSTLYKAKEIAACFTKEQIELAKDSSMAIGRMLDMTSKKVTPEIRQQLLLEAKNHVGPNVFDVKAAVEQKLSAATGGKPPKDDPGNDVTSAKKARKIVKGAEHIIALLENKIKDVGDAVESICGDDDATAMKAAYEQWDAASNAFDSLNATWQSQIKKAIKAFDKVKSVLKSK